MIEAFKESPLLILFIVSAIGYLVGNIPVRGSKLGVAAVLFVGLGFGALDPALDVPEIIIVLGLAIFVYTIGLSSGPAFFSTFGQRGFRDIFFVVAMLAVSAGITVGLHFLLGLDAATSAGLLAGSTTNTPALAGLLDLISNTQAMEFRTDMNNHAVVGYSLSYPMGVLGVIWAIFIMRKWMKVDYRKEEIESQKDYPVNEKLERQTVLVQNTEAIGQVLRHVYQKYNGRVVFGRMERGEEPFLPNMDTRLEMNDQIVIVADEKIIGDVITYLGSPMDIELTYDRTIYDVRRIFVSNPDIAGEKIAALNLPERYSTIITRVQRGDMDILATGETVLELGDRVLLIAKRSEMKKLSEFFGNSYEALSHINLLSFGSGMALGLLLGMVQFQLPGDLTFNLGYAGGPLIVALILGALRRSGPIVWTLPYSANLTLRQVGLILLLAGIGIRSGHTFLQTILQGGGFLLFLSGAVIATLTAMITLFTGYKILRIPFSILSGMVANQPAILEYAQDRSQNKLPTIGFASIFPVALITKILFVQLLFALLN